MDGAHLENPNPVNPDSGKGMLGSHDEGNQEGCLYVRG